MLLTEAPFPNPGSYADLGGQRGRILQHMPDGIVLLGIAGHHRRVALADLADPADDDVREQALLGGLREADTARAIWIARHLRNQNETTLFDLMRAMEAAEERGEVSSCWSRGHLATILRKLDWTAVRRASPAGGSSFVYIRTALRDAA